MRRNLFTLLCAACVLTGCASFDAAFAQRRRPAPKPRSQKTARDPQVPTSPEAPPMPVLPDIRNDPDVEAGDIVIIANITAKELRFDVVPNPTVEFPEKSKVESIWHADRYNLPDKIEPGVTYRNIGIRLKIVSRLADIDRIVSEALGEMPADQGVTPQPGKAAPTAPAAAQPTPASTSPVRKTP
jgi:hypothetical protein